MFSQAWNLEFLFCLCFGTLQHRVDRNIPDEGVVTTEPLTVGQNSFRFVTSNPIEALNTLHYLYERLWKLAAWKLGDFLLFCWCWMNSLWNCVHRGINYSILPLWETLKAIRLGVSFFFYFVDAGWILCGIFYKCHNV